jgi:hypothetical protein
VLSDVSRSSCQASFIVPFSTKIGMVQQILIKRPKIKFHENSLSGYRISNGDRRTYTQIGVYKRAGEYLLTARPQCSVNINTSKGNGLQNAARFYTQTAEYKVYNVADWHNLIPTVL